MNYQAWLELLCHMIPGVRSAIVVDTESDQSACKPIALWPSSAVDCSSFLTYVPLLKSKSAPIVTIGTIPQAGAEPVDSLLIAYPLNVVGHFHGAVVLEAVAKSTQQAVLLQMLKWGQEWLTLLLAQSINSDAKRESDSRTPLTLSDNHTAEPYLSVVRSALNSRSYQETVMTIATEIADLWGFERVWVGATHAGKYQVNALSHSANIDPRNSMVRDVESAMQEASANTEEHCICFDSSSSAEDSERRYTAHARLLERQHIDRLMTVLVRDGDKTIAVLVCEAKGTAEPRSDVDTVMAQLTHLSEYLGPLLKLHERSSRSVTSHTYEVLESTVSRWKVGRIGGVPLGVGLLAICLLFAGLVDGEFRVRADAILEGRIQRAVVAPFDGYIDSAFARAGETVQKGAAIAQLDDTVLKLEQQRWLNQKDEYTKQYRKELAGLNHSKARIIKSQIAQAEAQLQLVNSKLKRAALVAPLTGIIVEGDLSRSLGTPVEQGQVLFEIAPLDEYRVVLKIAEQDIPFLSQGQPGTLLLSAYPDEEISFQVEHFSAVYKEDQSRIWYRAEASLSASSVMLRPGMEGVAKVVVGQQAYLWIWFRKLANWYRLWLWSWTP